MAAERERLFEIDELFFSTTDKKGIITSGNQVFARVAAYDEAEMVGKPHSLIRHPDMPRCVFKTFWDTIEAGGTIAAYVKNLAKTGEAYWVMAIVVPYTDGYLSVRLKPSSRYLEVAKRLYAELRRLERQLGGERELARKEAMEASGARLAELLEADGFPDYTSFMHQALAAELGSRAAAAEPPHDATGPQRRALDHGRSACLSVTRGLDGLLGADLSGYVQVTELSRQLAGTSSFALELAESLRLFALNAILASSRLGSDGAALHAIAGIMRTASDRMRQVIGQLSDDLEQASSLLTEVGFRVAVAKLQSLMAIQFIDEMLRRRMPGPEHAKYRDPRTDDVALLADCLGDSLALLRSALSGLDERLQCVGAGAASLKHDLRVMSALETNGRIEAAWTADGVAVRQLFHEVSEHVALASTKVDDFASMTRLGGRIASRQAVDELDGSLDRLRQDTAALAAPPPPSRAPSAPVA